MRGVICTGILFCSLIVGVGIGLGVHGCPTMIATLLFGEHILGIFSIRLW